jgi:PGAP1-like protein
VENEHVGSPMPVGRLGADLRGASRLAFDATAGLTGLVEAMHTGIARVPTMLGGPVGSAVNGVTWLVYRSIHAATRGVGGGIDVALAGLAPMLGDPADSSPRREALVAALNGVLGDHLAESGNPLAITMQVRVDGRPIALTGAGVAAAFPRPANRLVVLVHGLCMNDLQWTRPMHCHGTELARDLGYAPVYVHYNTGRHVSTNGRALAATLEALVAAWPVPLEEIAVVAHSMGGLVSRSAHHYGTLAGHGWLRRLRKLVFLGTPHHGAALERAGHRLHRLVEKTPWVGPLAALGTIRSAGITDLRHGNLVDEDWQGRDRFAHGDDTRRPVPLPEDVACFAVAATTGAVAHDLRSRLVGDGLVPLASALGRHDDPRFGLAFPEAHQWVACDTGHFGLLERLAVYRRIRDWLAG